MSFSFSETDGIIGVRVPLGIWGLFDISRSGALRVVADYGYDGWWSRVEH